MAYIGCDGRPVTPPYIEAFICHHSFWWVGTLIEGDFCLRLIRGRFHLNSFPEHGAYAPLGEHLKEHAVL